MTRQEAERIVAAVRQAPEMKEIVEVIDANVACCVETLGDYNDYEENIRDTLGNKITDSNYCDYGMYLTASWILAGIEVY